MGNRLSEWPVLNAPIVAGFRRPLSQAKNVNEKPVCRRLFAKR
jgi:hypothetical protein